MERKYRNRPDISILVVEKSIKPLGGEQAKHDIHNCAYLLHGYGFSVDLVWTLSEHKFNDFEEFWQSILEALEKEKQEWRDLEKRTGLREGSFGDLYPTASKYELLRKTPINSIDDLEGYDFLVLHTSFDDSDMIDQIRQKYPTKPVIIPGGAVVSGRYISMGLEETQVRGVSRGNTIEGVIKGSRTREVYIVDDASFGYSVLELIEYLLDKREKTQKQQEFPAK